MVFPTSGDLSDSIVQELIKAAGPPKTAAESAAHSDSAARQAKVVRLEGRENLGTNQNPRASNVCEVRSLGEGKGYFN